MLRSIRGAAVRLVLVYHGIRGDRDAVGLFPPRLDAGVFRDHLDHLRASYEVVSLNELMNRGSDGRGSRVPVALTFDDDLRGYAELVAPLLRERDLPATFFLTGSALGGEFNAWWLDLEFLAGEPARWRSAVDELSQEWPWIAGTTPANLATTMTRLHRRQRDDLAEALRGLNGESGGDAGLDGPLIRRLATGGFEIGFHTRRHYALDTLNDDDLATAMTEGLDELAAAAGARPESIAYPHGRADLRVAHAAAGAGFKWGFTMGRDRGIRPDDSPLLLPRIDPYSGRVSVGSFAFRLARVATAAARGG
jgi:peptidoglycan/xylan/chitin deacetylase (PgdA/CDA1 family)